MDKRKLGIGCTLAAAGSCIIGLVGMAILGMIVGEQPKPEAQAPEESPADPPPPPPDPEPTPDPEAQPDPKPRLVGDDGEVHAEAFEAHGLKWPLVVLEGKVRCEPGLIASFVSPDGETYALNGIAKSRYQEIRPIWADNPKIEGTKIPISDMIEVALKLCERSP
ncbi:MAG: DUF2511 domain-containing protein [Myxococcota bacterium]